MLAQCGVAELAADQCGQRVVLALGVAAGVVVLAAWTGSPVTVGLWSAGLHIPGAAKRPARLPAWPAVRGWRPVGDAHAVGALASAPLETALGGAVLIGERAVGVEGAGQPVGDFLQLVGAQFGGFLGQERLGFLDLGGVDVLGQVADEVLDGAQVLDVEQAGCQALAVAGSRGGSACPVRLVRGCSWPVSRIRRRASAGVMRRTSATTLAVTPPRAGSSLRSIEPSRSRAAAPARRRTVSSRSRACSRSRTGQRLPVQATDGLHGSVQCGKGVRLSNSCSNFMPGVRHRHTADDALWKNP